MEPYSPAAIDTAPAISPATPASRTTLAPGSAPATPRISETFDTRPSLAPKTAARATPPWMSRWWCSETGGRGRGSGTGQPYARRVTTRYDLDRAELGSLLEGHPGY